MGSLEPRNENNEKVDLRSMVESLQSALYFHKQQIATEVKSIVSSEISQMVTASHQNLSEYLIKNFANLEMAVKHEIQSISYKIENVDHKSNEIIEKLKRLEETIQQQKQKVDKDLKEIGEKHVCAEQNISYTEQMVKELKENYLKLNSEIAFVKENSATSTSKIVSDLRLHLSDYRREIEGALHENESKMQGEVFKLLEKINEISHSLETIKNSSSCPNTNSFKPNIFKENELFEFAQAGLSKLSMEISQIRIRVEKLEIAGKYCEDFRRTNR